MLTKWKHPVDYAEPPRDAGGRESTFTQGWLRSTTFLDARIIISAVILGVLIGFCGVGLDRLVHHASRLYVSDLYTCVVASVFSYLLMIYEKRRRMILARRMAIAAEVKAKLARKRRRLSLLLNIALDPSSRNETLRPELDENDSQHEDQDVGDHRRHHPG